MIKYESLLLITSTSTGVIMLSVPKVDPTHHLIGMQSMCKNHMLYLFVIVLVMGFARILSTFYSLQGNLD